MFVGLPGSGKTTLIGRFLNLKEVEEMLKACASTGIVGGIIRVDVTEIEASMHAANIVRNCEWQKMEFGFSCLTQMGIGCYVVKQAPEDHTSESPTGFTHSQVVPVTKGSHESPKKRLSMGSTVEGQKS